MNESMDSQLLRAYVSDRSEPAFAELTRRHVDLVYSAAFRMIRDPHLAEDVTQGVFVALAKSARSLTDRAVLSGWLHRTAQNIAAQTVRTDVRRRAREQEAAAMNEILASTTEASWQQLAPHLDAALGDLPDADREALLLRYFERKSAREMAALLGVSDEAAQKRVNRAVDHLREMFAKRGIAVGAGGLVAAVSANAVQAAPTGLDAAVSSFAAPAGTGFGAATKVIAMTTSQKAFVAAIIAACIGTPLFFQQRVAAKLGTQRTTIQERSNRLVELEAQNTALSNRLARATGMPAIPPAEQAELLRLRAQAGGLRKQIDALSKTGKQQSRQEMLASIAAQHDEQVSRIKELLEANPGEKIPELQYLTNGNWLDLAWNSENETNFAKTASTARGRAENAFVNDFLHPALQQYAKQNNNQFPTDLLQLKPYFTAPVDDSVLQRWEIVPADQLAPYVTQRALGQGEEQLVATKTPVNAELDLPTVCGLSKVTAFADRPPNVWVRAH